MVKRSSSLVRVTGLGGYLQFLTDVPSIAPSTYVCFFVVVCTWRKKHKDVTEKTNIRQRRGIPVCV
ncbi:MAG: hypothetical protein GX416_04110 [Bacteroidales bacterium]|nr:hypothetical protein [Bacteroidales bacterium]